MRWAVEQRLRFIESRLALIGKVNRSDIKGRFRISLAQASKDISDY